MWLWCFSIKCHYSSLFVSNLELKGIKAHSCDGFFQEHELVGGQKYMYLYQSSIDNSYKIVIKWIKYHNNDSYVRVLLPQDHSLQ